MRDCCDAGARAWPEPCPWHEDIDPGLAAQRIREELGIPFSVGKVAVRAARDIKAGEIVTADDIYILPVAGAGLELADKDEDGMATSPERGMSPGAAFAVALVIVLVFTAVMVVSYL